METLENLFEQLKNHQKFGAIQQRAEKLYQFKPFIENFFQLHQLTVWARPILGTFSIVTGLGYLYEKAAVILPVYVAVVLAFLLLLLIEVGKNAVGGLGFRLLLKRQVTSYFLLALLLLLTSASVFLSVEGASVIYQKLDQKKSNLTSSFQLKKETLENRFNQQISEEKKNLEAFKKQVSWKGKINIYNKTNQQVIASHNERIDQLLKEKSDQLFQLKKEKEIALQKAETESSFNQTFWMIASGSVEVLILLCLWFTAYYPFRAYQDRNLVSTLLPSLNLQPQDFQKLVQLLQWQTPNQYSAAVDSASVLQTSTPHGDRAEENRIGFKSTSKDVMHRVSTNTAGVPKSETHTAGVRNAAQTEKVRTVTVQGKDGSFYNGYLINCKYCGTEAVMKSPQAKYCSEEHRWKDNKVRREASMKIPFSG